MNEIIAMSPWQAFCYGLKIGVILVGIIMVVGVTTFIINVLVDR